jgi:tetratricopeptide (TPR) repeat protein
MTLQALYEQAVGLHQRGNLADAERLYLQVLQGAPGSFGACHMLGVLRAQQGRGDEALALIGAALALRPDAPDALLNHANILKATGRLEDALQNYARALTVRPDYLAAQKGRDETAVLLAEALNRQGNEQLAAGDLAAALDSYDRALVLAPAYIDACNNRAVALWNLGRFEEALAGFDSALARRPHYVEAHFNRGNVLRDMLRLDEAMASFDRATTVDPGFAPAHRNKGFCALLRGDFARGLPLYEWRKKLSPPIEARSYPQPLWTGTEDVRGKTVFAYVEQGLGDTIQFWRFIAPLQARGARVIVSVQDGLMALMAHASPAAELVDSRAVPLDFDYHIPLMSLPLALGLQPDTISADTPYVSAEPARVAKWGSVIGEKGFKIGISWQGARGGVTTRAMPLSCFAGLSRLAGVRLISLQKGFGSEQIAALPAVETLGDDFDAGPGAFQDAAAVMQSLDLVITLDSALAHLAGAMGRPTWVALKRVPDWRWFLGGGSSPWYPGMRLFRQRADGDWDGVFAEMETQLRQLMETP